MTQPCQRCAQPGESCGTAGVAHEAAPCVVCGEPTRVRSNCGAARTARCPLPMLQAPEPAPEPAAPARRSTTPRPATGRERYCPEQSRASQDRRLAADKAILAAATAEQMDADGPLLRILHALEHEFLPLRHGRRPYLRPPLPAPVELAHIVSSFAWRRPYTGPTTPLDRSGAFVSAAASVQVAHGPLEHTGPMDVWSGVGYGLVDVHPWPHRDRLPSPLAGAKVGSQVWIPHPTIVRLTELEAAGMWPDVAILDSWSSTEPVRLQEWASAYVAQLRSYAIETWGRDSPQYETVKVAYGQAIQLMQGSAEPGQGRSWRCALHRTDIAHAVQAQSAATLHRWAHRCLEVTGPDLGPVELRNVDELVLPDEAIPLVTDKALRHPLVIDQTGIRLGSFKIKGESDGAEHR